MSTNNSGLRSRRAFSSPMHPEVQSDVPGACPECGMALERSPGTVVWTCQMRRDERQSTLCSTAK
jgi:hypothetical protein